MTPPAAWAGLPFFRDTYPVIARAIDAEPLPVYPPATHRFRALDLCPPDAVKVVILGQDPYHTPGKADGLAFSISQDFPGKLDSLGNIFKELHDDLGVSRDRTDLADWAAQGVLLLNTALSVPKGKPKAHSRLGWTELTRQVLETLSARRRAFVLWGGPAKAFEPHIRGGGHLVLRSAHPSPLSAYRGFFGSRPFSRVNDWLIENGETPINWTTPEAR
ncbi:uracil-DNA glycosylase [Salipiger aestuarii]|uniref:Uracil-DNA glycosylase n=1 Tax=Salipiger aestuarii TaxID=568098 RepID=A0A327YJ39_9RHOB|nr:uracil-DNA glycosylase [Salipiger aestuarii]EIE52283.1 uracil-DNA glycosylase [Citreicella sp. 357]KAA8609062.1 uracil-DNA glycosylase [Salipiger aestuarii]KAA8614263.1 uracil-DNA glycosylase [Salipiger aestuarii]KAB2542753.1 uracil-DNA glycosylase [Salipiger aestuarii]RAK20307.1 uracil-DNA glycosylase [Salipiger aestuarii]